MAEILTTVSWSALCFAALALRRRKTVSVKSHSPSHHSVCDLHSES